jgi:ABC-2 type transport system permease protein
MLNKLLTVMFYTTKEILKSRVLLNTLFIGIGLFVVTYVAYSFTYGEPARIALDFGLGSLTLSSVSIAIFMGVGLLSNEIESRTVYMVISRPIPRSVFLLGKIMGLSLILILNIIILSAISLILYFLIGGSYQGLISWTIFFIGIEAVLMLVVVCFFSLITSKVLSVILSIMIYFVGHAIDGTKLLTFVQMRPFVKHILDIYHYLLPGFYKFNLKDFLLYKQSIEASYLLGTALYGIIYGLALVSLSMYIFEKKNLD